MPKLKRKDIDRLLKQCQTPFADFREFRENWRDLVHRDIQPEMDVRLGADVAHYASPDLEEAEHDFADILTMNPTRFDVAMRETGEHAKEAGNDAKLLAAHTWAFVENRGRWIDRANAVGQARYGVNVLRMLHSPIEEPDTEGMKDRDEAMRQQPWPFCFEQSSVLGSSWQMKGQGWKVFAYEYEVPVLSAREEYEVSGKDLNKHSTGYDDDRLYRPAVDKATGKLCWLGNDEAVDESVWDRKLKGIIIEYQDTESPCPICPDKHPLWAGVELLRADGQDIKDGEIIQEYTLPYKHAGSFRVVPGRVVEQETDPNRHYRPLEYRLLVEATIINWCDSMLQTLANRDSSDSRVYVSLSSMSDGVAGRLPDEFFSKMTVPLPDAGSNEVPVISGDLLAWPTNMSEMLIQYRSMAYERFERAKPNRFLVGENFQEAESGTGSANLQSTQQARLPFGWLLAQSDDFMLKAKEDQFHAIRYWDYLAEDKAEEMKYYVALIGDEPVMKGKAEPGRDIFVSASKLEYKFQLVLRTESETLQEQIQKQTQALLLHDKGWLDPEQTVERLGFYDSEDQLRKLAKYRLQKQMAPLKLELQTAALKAILWAVADIDPAMLQAQAQPAPTVGPAQPTMQQAQPTIQLPAIQGPQGGGPLAGAGMGVA